MKTMDVDLVRKFMDFDPRTGLLTWLPRAEVYFTSPGQHKNWNARYPGNEALSSIYKGYKHGHILKMPFLAHRVAWAHYYGEWPNSLLDHINGQRHDNRIANLRVVNKIENARNAKMNANNTSGATGVSFRGNAWIARISDGRKLIQLGTFATIEEAVAARQAAERSLQYHENHGRPQ